MKGFPHTLATKADLLNCLALAQATPPAFPASILSAAIEQIEAGAWLHLPIVSNAGKTVTVMYCGEANAGQATGNGPKITAVEHKKVEDTGEEIDDAPKTSVITLSSALSDSDTELLVPAPVSTAQRMGITDAEIKNIKGVLNSL